MLDESRVATEALDPDRLVNELLLLLLVIPDVALLLLLLFACV